MKRPDITNFDRRIRLLKYRAEGLSFNEMARKEVCSPQTLWKMFKKLEGITVEDLEKEKDSFNDSTE